MKQLDGVNLTSSERRALTELQSELKHRFDVETLMIYGSVARNEADGESDIDVLVITKHLLTRFERHDITDVVFEMNLRYGTNFSTLVVDLASWDNGLFAVLPLKDEILSEGVVL